MTTHIPYAPRLSEVLMKGALPSTPPGRGWGLENRNYFEPTLGSLLADSMRKETRVLPVCLTVNEWRKLRAGDTVSVVMADCWSHEF